MNKNKRLKNRFVCGKPVKNVQSLCTGNQIRFIIYLFAVNELRNRISIHILILSTYVQFSTQT